MPLSPLPEKNSGKRMQRNVSPLPFGHPERQRSPETMEMNWHGKLRKPLKQRRTNAQRLLEKDKQ